ILYPTSGSGNSDYDIAEFANVNGPDPDSYTLWRSDQAPQQGGYNLTYYSNSKVDQSELDQRQTPARGRRNADFRTIHSQLLSDVPVIYLYARYYLCVVCEGLQHYDPISVGAGDTWNVQEWQISITASIPSAHTRRSVAAYLQAPRIPLGFCGR